VEHAQAATIEARVERDDTRLSLTVQDDGGGLPAGFDLSRSTRLGLQIVRTLVESELRGTLTLDAATGSGTAACVVVPLSAGA